MSFVCFQIKMKYVMSIAVAACLIYVILPVIQGDDANGTAAIGSTPAGGGAGAVTTNNRTHNSTHGTAVHGPNAMFFGTTLAIAMGATVMALIVGHQI